MTNPLPYASVLLSISWVIPKRAVSLCSAWISTGVSKYVSQKSFLAFCFHEKLIVVKGIMIKVKYLRKKSALSNHEAPNVFFHNFALRKGTVTGQLFL
ncbi:hypothetical protein BJV82DRAFT_631028 [Fennellomyces sp. T-0311]|nr:hypothetical protein BJV82DRAFT_631028 [Fennellomyces sp. T-0311]